MLQMLRRFKGPRLSAASKIVALKPGEQNATEQALEAPVQESASATDIEAIPEPNNDEVEVIEVSTPIVSPVKPALTSILVDPARKKTFDGLRSPVRFADQIDGASSTSLTVVLNPEEEDNEPEMRDRTPSLSSVGSTSTTSIPSPPKKRKKRIFESDEEFDPTKFTMADLIDYRPKAENNLRKKWKELQLKYKEDGFTVKREKKEPEDDTFCPKIKLDEDGNPMIDEESLVIRKNPEAEVFEAVDDDLIPKKLNSLSFKKNYERAKTWSELETELFYEILSATGTDFSLMHEYLPFKNRLDIKKKFRKEEKVNMRRINETLKHPTMLDPNILKERVNKAMVLIDKEIATKKAKKLIRRRYDTDNSIFIEFEGKNVSEGARVEPKTTKSGKEKQLESGQEKIAEKNFILQPSTSQESVASTATTVSEVGRTFEPSNRRAPKRPLNQRLDNIPAATVGKITENSNPPETVATVESQESGSSETVLPTKRKAPMIRMPNIRAAKTVAKRKPDEKSAETTMTTRSKSASSTTEK